MLASASTQEVSWPDCDNASIHSALAGSSLLPELDGIIRWPAL